MHTVLIIGAFGYSEGLINGQTIKTRSVYEVLSTRYKVDIFDTQELKGNKFFIFKLVFFIFRYKYIYYVGAQSNLRFFFPLLFLASKIRKGRVVYVTVGGWLFDFLKSNNKIYTFMLKNIRSILVQTSYLKENLQSLGFRNVDWVPNFRITPEYYICEKEDPNVLRIAFMARIVKEKGIYLIFEMLNDYISSSDSFNKQIKVDFYGPVAEADAETFSAKINELGTVAGYHGVLKPQDIYRTLTMYDVLLLPTYYPGEGFPGTILDAYLCGLPVIATRWKQIPEFVADGRTGFLIDYDSHQLLGKIRLLSNNEGLLKKMKAESYRESKKYSAEAGLQVLEESMFC